MLSLIGCCGFGEQEIEHLHSQRKRSKGWLGLNGGDVTVFGLCRQRNDKPKGRKATLEAKHGEDIRRSDQYVEG